MKKDYKQRIGKAVFSKFENKLTVDHFKDDLYNTRITAAAEIAEEKPFVTTALRDNGILLKGERNTHLLHAFQPNLWAQDYAHEIGKLGKMTVSTAIERANASVEHILSTSKNIAKTLKRTGAKEYDFYVAMREAAMIESAYYTRLGGGDMSDISRKKIDVALMRRAIRNESMFQTVLRHAGVKEEDGLALLHFAEEIDLTGTLQELVRLDPYFNRRTEQVGTFSKINSSESFGLNNIKGDKFMEELLLRVSKKHPALFRRIASIVA